MVEHEVANKRVHKEAQHHHGSADDERAPATALLHDVEATKGARDIDGSENDLRHVAVVETRGLEDGGAVVEEEVGARELLTRLQNKETWSAIKDPIDQTRERENNSPEE